MIACEIGSLDILPLVAILRGVTPDEAVGIGEAIVEAGFLCLEVPLNSPQALDSIRLLRARLEGRALVGAGTVLTVDAVHQIADAGSQLCISPNTDVAVIRAAKARGLLSLPGFFTATEAFQAIQAGADALKAFPADVLGLKGLAGLKAGLCCRRCRARYDRPMAARGGLGFRDRILAL
jgi:2-dehydro-3-deoxyphosphogalactonate aldolase